MPFHWKFGLLRVLWLVIAAGAGSTIYCQPVEPGPESVVVVANAEMAGSKKVAKAYMERRQIPKENLIVIKAPVEEHIPRSVYLNTIHNPILDALIEKKLVDAFDGPVDDLGRKTATVFSSKVRYMVLCYGVPTKVQSVGEEQAKKDLYMIERQFKRSNPNLIQTFQNGRMSKNEASVDGELAVILKRDVPLRGFYPNPIFDQQREPRFQDIIRVTRLDGPSPEAVIRMLDNALAGERNGLKGRAYVDEDGRGGGFALGNQWLASCADLFKSMGFDTGHDKRGAMFSPVSRFDAPVLYAGWYGTNCTGPFNLPGFQFPEGAVAAHLHSFSASKIRSKTSGWVGPFVEKGVSATFGNVSEPYLSLTHHFDRFFAALANGSNFGDAAYAALPCLSWQAVAIGDPLYRPFAVNHESQFDSIGDPLKILKDQYVVLRQINLLEAAGKQDEALQVASRGMRDTPGPALALRRAKLYQAKGDTAKALSSLSFTSSLRMDDASEWGLYLSIADTLVELGKAGDALEIYKKIEQKTMPEQLLLAFLKRGIKVAQQAGDVALAIEWEARTTPPPPIPEPEKPADTPEKS